MNEYHNFYWIIFETEKNLPLFHHLQLDFPQISQFSFCDSCLGDASEPTTKYTNCTNQNFKKYSFTKI